MAHGPSGLPGPLAQNLVQLENEFVPERVPIHPHKKAENIVSDNALKKSIVTLKNARI